MNNYESSGRVAVIVPLYKSSLFNSEEFSLNNTSKILKDHDLYIIGPNSLRKHFLELNSRVGPNFRIKLYPDIFFESIDGYNKLLMSKFFYSSFSSYEYILILQVDALVFSDQLESWCNRNYSYVGAPWFEGFSKPNKPLKFLGVGNGGLSLRKVNDFIRVLSFPRYMPSFKHHNTETQSLLKLSRWYFYNLIFAFNFQPFKSRQQEDIFWGLIVPKYCDFFTVASASEAVAFSFEVEPEYLFKLNLNKLPFGCHAWEKYNPNFWKKVLSAHDIKIP